MKKIISVSLAGVLLLALGGMVFASGFDGPAEIYSKLTGVSVEEAYQERGNDKTFGQLAEDKGMLEEFRKANIEAKKAILAEKVEQGVLTQEQADEIIKAMEEDCTLEPGTNRWGQEYGLGFGANNGQGNGQGLRRGQGRGYGKGNGQGKGYGQGRGYGQGVGCTMWDNTSNDN